MVRRRSVELLPEIFQTPVNKQFLSATLDQLVQEPNFLRVQGYVGRRVGPGVNPADNYVTEPNATRSNYQLEPGVVFCKENTNTAEDVITYPGIIDSLSVNGGDTQNQSGLFKSEYYAWDAFCDFDKFVNYSQYYWLPSGPLAVDVSSTIIPLTDSTNVTRSTNYYEFSGVAGENPVITLVRGGNYTFNVNQIGHKFYIQAAPGINGTMPYASNISSRDVLGVENNGEDQGSVTFAVPDKTAQDFYYNLTSKGTVDLVTNLQFIDINNRYVSDFLAEYPTGIDSITSLAGKTVIFLNDITDAQDGGWQVTTQFDPLTRTTPNQVGISVSYDVNGEPYDNVPYNFITNRVVSGSPDPLDGQPGSFDTTLFDQTTDIPFDTRYSVWQIEYVLDDDGEPFMRLSPIKAIDRLDKLQVLFGQQYASTNFYRNASGFYEPIPLLTAVLDTLYYQDGSNPEIFGRIKLVDQSSNNPIDFEDIIGAKNYVSPNGVRFTNGLKVQFRGPTTPPQFQDLEFYVEGVGTGPGIERRVGFVDGEAYFGPFHRWQNQLMTGAVHSEEYFQQFIYETIEESLANKGVGAPQGAPLSNVSQFGASVGNGIKLIPVRDLVTPEQFNRSETVPYDSTSYDSTPYDESLNAPTIPDYLTINRSAKDQNPWSRNNRWFHIDVISYSAELNNTVPVIDNDFRARRPIVEFRGNLRLFNFGTQSKTAVNIVDFVETDALSNINGQLGYSIDGYNFMQGSRVIFAADIDPQVRNRIYEVTFIDPNNSGVEVINLVPASDSQVYVDQTVVCLSGVQQQGLTYWFDGATWRSGQQKTGINQPPLFDVYDSNGISYSNRARYPSSNFAGTKLFSYALGGTQATDEVLGFALKYLNINNVGDILFENYLYTDTFTYVENNVGQEKNISEGFVRQYIDRVSFSNQIGWQTAVTESQSRQVFRFVYESVPLVLDIPVTETSSLPALQIFVGSNFLDPGKYTYTVTETNTFIVMPEDTPAGVIIEVQALSDKPSRVGFYQVPLNLEKNPFNVNSPSFTLGTIRSHYESIGQNLKNLVGPINGANNSRDLGNIIAYGDQIIQNSSPMTLPGALLRRQQFEFFASLRFNSVEYNKYKALLVSLASQGDFINLTATQILDQTMQEISLAKTENSPFYWSDMIPSGETYTENTYTYTPISTPTFDTVQTYDFNSSNYLGLSVYLNGDLLQRGYQYIVNEGPTLTITVPLSVGDSIVIREYPSTVGSFVPNTPTKLGLYPAYRPEIYLDASYVVPTLVIRGHDGSITKAYGDVRDQVLLEFENRIFNNLKIHSAIPLQQEEVVAGQFRTTDFPLATTTKILSEDFLAWIGYNKIDYTSQVYVADDPFTWNYSQTGSRINGGPLPGAWRGIYNYFYDTDAPTTRPWEMLGFSQEPTWWESTYGPAPYTSGNQVLWGDLERGFINDPVTPKFNPLYARPGLSYCIPAGSEGELLPPLQSAVGSYDVVSFQRSWRFGDDGPAETAWRNSSDYPFAVMRLLALTKPAKFFSLFIDRDRYVYDESLQQYLWDSRFRLDCKDLGPLYGSGQSKASWLNWVIDYNKQLGINSTQELNTILANLDVRLIWRLAGFSAKNYLKIFTERSTPNSLNTSLLLPDESYQILLYKNQPAQRSLYSSVIVQANEDGWAVFGYDPINPYFNILESRPQGPRRDIFVAGTSVKVPTTYSDNVARIPYGYVFTNRAAVCDFLLSYGALLTRQGFKFENTENGYVLNWDQMAQEFLYWTQQGWGVNSLINLNPSATRISVTSPGQVADSLATTNLANGILNQNRQPINVNQINIERVNNTVEVSTASGETLNFLYVDLVTYEHVIVLDNTSIFADLIYSPATGARQSRVLVSGSISGDWQGYVDAPGFVLNENNIVAWIPNRTYTKGEIVLYKDQYWTASTIIQPSQNFDYSLWLKSDYDEIQKGLLPNAANSSDQLAKSYSVFDANLEQEVDLFSYGLIGFRPREYMQALNLDDVSQVQLYQQFLGTKGTRQSAEFFTLADLGKESAEYLIREYWSILKATYGANANRSYIELLLNQALLPSNPCTVEIIEPGQTGVADQNILLGDVWKESYKLTSSNVFPTVNTYPTDIGLPSAGYVKLDDVNITLFDINDVTSLNQSLGDIGLGAKIWVAKNNPYDWNVYRASLIPGEVIEVTDNLNSLSVVTMNDPHGLSVGDYFIIKNFDDRVNGVYRVLSIPSIFSVLINYVFTGTVTTITGRGVAFTLDTSRVAQASDINLLPYANQLRPGTRVWVDNNGRDKWEVLEKTDVFVMAPDIAPQFPQDGALFGSSVSQGFQNLTALVGAPGLSAGTGATYVYFRADTDQYEEQAILTLNTPGNVQGFGNAVDMGDQAWAVVGASTSDSGAGYAATLYRAPGSNAVAITQLLVPPDLDFAQARFGSSVTMSQDEHWLFVGAPGNNRVYTYQRVPVQQQAVEYITDGTTFIYNWQSHIVLTDPASLHQEQMSVILDNQVLTYGSDWLLSNENIILTSVPPAKRVLRIIRNQARLLDQSVYRDVSAAVSTGAGTGALFEVTGIRGSYTVVITNGGSNYSSGDVLTILGTDVGTGNVTAGQLTTGRSYVITTLGTTDFTLVGASANTIGEIFTATGPGTGTGTASQNLEITVTQTGSSYSSILIAGINVISVDDASELYIGQTLVQTYGTGALGPGATITNINYTTNTIEVSAVNTTEGYVEFYADPGPITLFTVVGDGVGDTAVFPLEPYLATATNISSITVNVNGEIYRPEIDYDFNSDSALDSRTLVFNTIPPFGALITVTADDYWQPMSILSITPTIKNLSSSSGKTLVLNNTTGIYPGMYVSGNGFNSGLHYVESVDNATTVTLNLNPDVAPSGPIGFEVVGFGHSVSTTTDGRQIMIGCAGKENSPGSVYIYDRSVEKFVVTNPTTTIFNTSNTIEQPCALQINGTFQVNTELNIGGTFTINNSNTVTVSTPLEVGDTVTIDTNHFVLLQQVFASDSAVGARFGYTVDQCVNNCSLYVGAPYYTGDVLESGQVTVLQNQSRLYGTIISLAANPVLTPGSTLRINDILIELYSTDINGNAQPATVESLLQDIHNASNPALLSNPATASRYHGLSNVSAALTPDLSIIADGFTKTFDVGTIWSSAPSYNPKVLVNGIEQTLGVDYTYDNVSTSITFAVAPQTSSVITAVSGRLILSVKNVDSAPIYNKLVVLPGTGNLFSELGYDLFVNSQTIYSPILQDLAHFGEAIFIGDDTRTLIVGAPNGTTINPTTFDNNTTTWDNLSTTFSDGLPNSGAVYIYDLLNAANPSVNNPNKFVFGQQLVTNDIATLDRFGAALDYTTGKLLVGLPGDAISTDSGLNRGAVQQRINPNLAPAWSVLRQQTPVVDVDQFNSVFMYDVATGGAKEYFDFFDPLQGKLLGVVRQNLDYVGAVDPARYNVGPLNNQGNRWGQGEVGRMWWDTSTVRFIDPNQNDILYASRRWGEVFPGSVIRIYQWVASPVPPAQYTGAGVPKDTQSYVVVSGIDQQGFFVDGYYFWVEGINSVDRSALKTLSAENIARYIDNPRASGIPYIAPVAPNAIAIYNGNEYISAQDTVIHLEFDRQLTDNNVHVEYQLVPQGAPEGFLAPGLYRKLLDSFCGSDTAGNPVPDPLLLPSERYGVQYRPRQSFFVNRFLALQNYLGRANEILQQIPILENRQSSLLNSFEPEPSASSGEWDMRVANIEELGYQDLRAVPIGYRYLVSSDSTNNGLWTIYEVENTIRNFGSKDLLLIRVQNYDTRKYWTKVDWYQPKFNPDTRITTTVRNYASLLPLTDSLPQNSVVKVLENGRGEWEIYQKIGNDWVRVALQNGTLQISEKLWNYGLGRFGFDIEVFDGQYYDQEPVIETRKILEAINQELFVGDLLIERNNLLILMFNYILSEQIAPVWLTKTSLIDVEHVIRDLVPFQVYRRDNQDFVRNYIEEVKPYRTQIRQFDLIYRGFDDFQGSLTDFDLPAYWDGAETLYISPVLDDSGNLSTTSSVSSTSPVWQTFPYNQWYQNYLLSIQEIVIIDGGQGYTEPPVVEVIGDAQITAVLTAKINSAGRVIAIEVDDPGQGYSETAIISISGGNGTGARAVAVMGNQLVRSVDTHIKYDRYEYRSSIIDWRPNLSYDQDTLVRNDNRVWEANQYIAPSASFDPQEWTLISAGDLSGVDRTMGYYVPTVNEPGLDLALLIQGVDYPGVQVAAPGFEQDTGFDVGAYDVNVFDNISFGPDGQPSYDPAILDAIYASQFDDPYLGVGAAAINVDGGEFVDTYSSHAPEELIPGAIFDTLDIRVFTTPGSNWGGDSGFSAASVNGVYAGPGTVIDYDNLLDNVILLKVYNQTQGLLLTETIDYQVDYVDYTVQINQGAAVGDTIKVSAISLGGGNQLYTATYRGDQTVNGIIVPVSADLIENFAVFVNGQPTTQYEFSSLSTTQTLLSFDIDYSAEQRVTFTAMGATVDPIDQGWCAPLTQIVVSDGSPSIVLTNSLSGTNPVNLIVTVNGARARPYDSVLYQDDASSLTYYLPTRGGYNQALVANNDVSVYVNGTLIVQGVDYTVDPYVLGQDRTITLTVLPPAQAEILISVRTAAQYFVNSNVLTFQASQGLLPAPGDVITITTFNNTAEQTILTQIYVGPETQGFVVTEGYDTTLYDSASVSGTPGSYDYSAGIQTLSNRFPLQIPVVDTELLVVSLNGKFLFNNVDYVIEDNTLEILGPTIGPIDTVVITILEQSTIPGAIAFRIFQDMRGLQSTYRILADTSTQLTQPVLATDDIIHVQNASNLTEPDLVNGVFGIITIDGERITYRNRDVANNSVWGLRRGTAGTAAAAHAANTPVYDMSRANLLPVGYQNYYQYQNFLADGSTTIFATDDIMADGLDSIELGEAVQVFVGGIQQTTGYSITGTNPVTIVFDEPPMSGYQVSVRVYRGQSWYQPAPPNPSNGQPLQETDTAAARFIRGE